MYAFNGFTEKANLALNAAIAASILMFEAGRQRRDLELL